MIEGALVERGPLSSGPLSPVPRSVDPARIAALSPAPWLAARRKVKRRLRSLGRQTLTHSWDILPRGKTATPNCMIYSTARWNDVETSNPSFVNRTHSSRARVSLTVWGGKAGKHFQVPWMNEQDHML